MFRREEGPGTSNQKAKSFVVHTERTAGSSIQMNARVYNDCTWGKGRGGKKKEEKKQVCSLTGKRVSARVPHATGKRQHVCTEHSSAVVQLCGTIVRVSYIYILSFSVLSSPQENLFVRLQLPSVHAQMQHSKYNHRNAPPL